MNPEQNEQLDSLLREWRVQAPPSPNFRAEVWQRIAAEESAASVGWRGVLRSISGLWASGQLNPGWAVALVLVATTFGAGLGHRAAERNREAEWSQMGLRYAHSINPLAMASMEPAELEQQQGLR